MSDAFRAGKYHAETQQPSLLANYTRFTFGYYDYLEGQSAGFNELYWSAQKLDGDKPSAHIAAYWLPQRDRIKAILVDAGRR